MNYVPSMRLSALLMALHMWSGTCSTATNIRSKAYTKHFWLYDMSKFCMVNVTAFLPCKLPTTSTGVIGRGIAIMRGVAWSSQRVNIASRRDPSGVVKYAYNIGSQRSRITHLAPITAYAVMRRGRLTSAAFLLSRCAVH